jgi:hypothetical protein
MLKSLEYDRKLEKNESDIIKIGIVYQENYRASVNAKNDVNDFVFKNNPKIFQKQVSFVILNILNIEQIKNILETANIDVIYITPLRSIDVEKLAMVFINNKILAMSGVAEYIKYKIPFTVDYFGRRPKIIIDLNISRKSGVDFDSKLLELSKVIITDDD